ncbi:DUF2207 domain-containing protein [Nocardioides ferulae]|uniref:DUF2207 domain-containing protein n=1 Tax=Nocardioides ferulae TaxID=2340821 RepID=UPI0013DDDDD8|nr:DUF2207 domain-containing protein [Nocardioides ferulae]
MKRLVATVVGLAVLAALLFLPAAFWNLGSEDQDPETTRIIDYRADFTVDEDGDLTVEETLTVDFPSGKHGIFRFFDRADSSAPNARRTPEDIEVTMDGGPVEFEVLEEDHGRLVTAKIGDPYSTVARGEHVYRIGYTIDGVLEPGTDGADTQLYWNLIPSGWRQAIDRATLTVHLPAPAEGVRCAVGVGETSGCDVAGDGTDTLTVRATDLAPNTPVTVKVGLDIPTPEAGETLPWTARFDRVLGSSVVLLVIVVLLAALAAIGGWILAARTKETEPGFPLMYAPPDGVGPAQVTYLLEEDVDEETYVATLMYAAERGAIDLDKSDDAWTVTDKAGAQGWAGLDPITGSVAHLLSGPGSTFVASPKDVEAGKRLKKEMESFEEKTEAWAEEAGLVVSAGLGAFGAILVIAAAIAAGAALIWNPFSMTMVGLVPGAFAVCALPLLKTGAATKRTPAARELWSRAGGFRRVLSTPSSVQRFDFSGREELYTKYIPWAVAFGCADEWAEKYRTEMAAEPPRPSYFAHSYAGAYTGAMVGSMVNDFSSTLSSAVSAYQATQSSSSSGGGGFSGGGGGGGGGGGSW